MKKMLSQIAVMTLMFSVLWAVFRLSNLWALHNTDKVMSLVYVVTGMAFYNALVWRMHFRKCLNLSDYESVHRTKMLVLVCCSFFFATLMFFHVVVQEETIVFNSGKLAVPGFYGVCQKFYVILGLLLIYVMGQVLFGKVKINLPIGYKLSFAGIMYFVAMFMYSFDRFVVQSLFGYFATR